MPSVKAVRSPLLRIGQLVIGVLLVIAAPLLAPLPGPAGIFLFAGGMVLILRNSRWARLKWARLKRRWPRTGHFVDRMMRRQSAMRRHERAKVAKNAPVATGAN